MAARSLTRRGKNVPSGNGSSKGSPRRSEPSCDLEVCHRLLFGVEIPSPQWRVGMKPDVEIYDTTLRDGSQGEGINFSVADKFRIAERLDAFGMHYIEGGWPGSNPKDIEFFAQARRKKFKRARLAAFGATRRKGVPVQNDEQVRLLLGAETPVVTIVGKTWLLHVQEVLRTTPEENLAMIGETIRYLKDQDKFVIY